MPPCVKEKPTYFSFCDAGVVFCHIFSVRTSGEVGRTLFPFYFGFVFVFVRVCEGVCLRVS